MSDGRSGNPALGAMVGDGGDFFIPTSTTTCTSGLIFSHIYITADAVVNTIEVGDVKISDAGVASLPSVSSAKASRNYVGKTLPQGYLICAGRDKGIKHTFKLTSGSAEGIIFQV